MGLLRWLQGCGVPCPEVWFAAVSSGVAGKDVIGRGFAACGHLQSYAVDMFGLHKLLFGKSMPWSVCCRGRNKRR
jgi:hypothetical protein